MDIEIIAQILSSLSGKGSILFEIDSKSQHLTTKHINDETTLITGFKVNDLHDEDANKVLSPQDITTILHAVDKQQSKASSLLLKTKRGLITHVQAQITPIINKGECHNVLITFERENRTTSIEAEKTQQARLDFFTNVSHELRTPINGIIGLVEILHSDDNEKDRNEHLESIRGCSLSLLNIINTIINFSKFNAGELNKNNITFSVKNLTNDVQQTYEPEIKAKGLKLIINVQHDTPEWLKADITLIKQVILNLLSNAVKFTDDGYIKLSLMWQTVNITPEIIIEVEDTGIGIAPEFKAKLYESFSQEDTSITRKFGGLGLGLSVTKNSVDILGGNMALQSTQGQGTKFTVTVPIEMPNSKDLEGLRSSQTVQLEEETEVFDDLSIKDMKILVVEDNHVNQVMMERWLKRMGFGDIYIANNGFESLTLLRHNTFDVILMDCQMPELDGYETTSLIRDMEKKEETNTPIIAVTANASNGEREKCLDCGMNDYLTKPTSFIQLQSTIAKWLHISKNIDINTVKAQARRNDSEQTTVTSDLTEAPIINMEIMNDFTEGDMDLEKQFIGIFLEKGWEHVEKMRQNKEDLDTETWKIAAHSLKGAAANIGADHLQNSCLKAEEAFDCSKDEKEHLLELIKTDFENVRDFFKERHA